jgi:hypothetical protein
LTLPLQPEASNGDGANIAVVAPAELSDAAQTLSNALAMGLVDEARRCAAPLAYVTLAKAAADASGTLRFRSGNYVSPVFLLTDAPQRIALPFPAPYPAGKGTITVEGGATGAVLGLLPPSRIDRLAGSTVIPVWWTPRKFC